MSDLRRLMALYRPYRGWMLAGVFLAWITVIANVGLMAISGWFIASMAIAGLAGSYMNYFTPGAVIRFFAITRTGGRYAERLVTHEATFRLLSELRRWFYEHLEPLAPAALQQYHSGDLLSRISADIDTLQNFYLRVLTPSIVALLSTLVFVAFLAFFDPLIALLELSMLVLAGMAVPFWAYRKATPLGRKVVEKRSEMRQTVIDGVHGLGELMVYGASDKQAGLIHQQGADLIAYQGQLARVNGASQGAVSLFANLAMLLVMVIAIPQVEAAEMPPPYLAMLALFVVASFEAVIALPLAFQSLPETLAAARRVFAIVDAPAVVAEPEQPLPMPDTLDIQFRDVVFAYSDESQPALNSLSFQWLVGKNVAIVGPTGSGKSTVTNLLLGFWPASHGEVLINSQPVHLYAGEDLRRCFAVVPQQAHLFNATIRQNLLLAKPEASDAELEQVCRLAHLDDFIQSQSKGWDTHVGEAGLKLSGGQARRLVIARALLKDAPVLILDEPAEGLDPQLENQVMTSVLEHYADRSVLLITHRRAGLERMDAVITLDRGQRVDNKHLGAYV